MSGELGKASLELDVDLSKFEKNITAGRKTAGDMEDALDAIKRVAIVAEIQLNKVKLDARTGTESNAIADRIERSVSSVGRAAMEASQHLQEVKLTAAQAAESDVAGDIIDRKLKGITRNANEARRATESVRIAGFGAGGNPGAGIGPFGSGFGRIGLLGTAIGGGALLAPSAGPAMVGLLGAVGPLAASGAGAIGVLALAFQGLGKAIGGDKKAFDELTKTQQQFVQEIRSLTGWLDQLKETAADSMFPGFSEGLHAALSSGTVNAITVAIQEFGAAIGQAGATWGRYFGSAEFQSIFIPLMAAGAHNLTLMSTAALALFDAFGVLSRAAIPFTTWLMTAATHGAQLVDSWLHAKDASGGLSRAMTEAQRSLQLVGSLLASLVRVVGELGVALYPVSRVAVADLTQGLNALAALIRRNQTVIREIVSTALAGFVTAVKIASSGVEAFNTGLSHIIGSRASVVTAVLAIGAAITLTLGPQAAVITGVILAVGLIQSRWQLFGEWFGQLTDWIVDKFRWVAMKIGDMLALIPRFIAPALHDAGVDLQNWAKDTGSSMGDQMGASFNEHLKAAMYQGALTMKDLTKSGFNTDLMTGGSLRQFGGLTFTGKDLAGTKSSLLDAIAQAVADMGGNQVQSINITSAKRPPGPGNDVKNSNHITGDAVDGFVVLKNGTTVPLGTYIKSIAGAYGLRSGDVAGFDPKTKGGFDPVHVDDGANVGGAGGGGTTAPVFGTPPPFSKNVPTPKVPTIITGDKLIPAEINRRIANFANIAANSAGKVAEAALEKERNALLAARDAVTSKLKGAKGEQRQAIKDELADLNNKLRDVNKAVRDNIAAQKKAVADALAKVKTTFAGRISTAQTGLVAMFQRIQADIDAALQARFAKQMAELGATYHQNGSLTPSEKRLADAQRAETQLQLQQALDDATQAYNDALNASLVYDASTGLTTSNVNHPALVAAQRQLDAANAAIAQDELQAKATAERTKADQDYAAELAKLQDAQRLEQLKLSDALARFGGRVQDGTSNMGDLNAVLAPFGISIADIPADQLAYDMGNLGDATQTLANVMLSEAVALAKLGDSKDAKALAAKAQQLLAGIDAGIPSTVGITNSASIYERLGRKMEIPMLDTGGSILNDGVIYGHAGETIVPADVSTPFAGGDGNHSASVASVGNEIELGLMIGRMMQKANKSGIRFQLV